MDVLISREGRMPEAMPYVAERKDLHTDVLISREHKDVRSDARERVLISRSLWTGESDVGIHYVNWV